MRYSSKLKKAFESKYKMIIDSSVLKVKRFRIIDGNACIVVKLDTQEMYITSLEYFGVVSKPNGFGSNSVLSLYFTHIMSEYIDRQVTITDYYSRENKLKVFSKTDEHTDITAGTTCEYTYEALHDVLCMFDYRYQNTNKYTDRVAALTKEGLIGDTSDDIATLIAVIESIRLEDKDLPLQ